MKYIYFDEYFLKSRFSFLLLLFYFWIGINNPYPFQACIPLKPYLLLQNFQIWIIFLFLKIGNLLSLLLDVFISSLIRYFDSTAISINLSDPINSKFLSNSSVYKYL